MEILNKLKLLAFQLFVTVNPCALVLILIVSFFSDNYALKLLKIEHWVFVITLVFAIPQLIVNYKQGDYEKD